MEIIAIKTTEKEVLEAISEVDLLTNERFLLLNFSSSLYVVFGFDLFLPFLVYAVSNELHLFSWTHNYSL